MWLTVSDNIMTQHHGFPNDDIVTTLRTMVQFTNAVAGGVCWRAADEIERLRASLNIAAGKLSTLPPYTEWHPETIYKALLEDGVEAVRGE
jgi:hypothetical protein